MNNITKSIISMLGGGAEVARICGITPGAVSQWDSIPSRHQSTILNAGRKKGIDIKPEHFIPMPKTKYPPNEAKHNGEGA